MARNAEHPSFVICLIKNGSEGSEYNEGLLTPEHRKSMQGCSIQTQREFGFKRDSYRFIFFNCNTIIAAYKCLPAVRGNNLKGNTANFLFYFYFFQKVAD
jgi:hypothetical protein